MNEKLTWFKKHSFLLFIEFVIMFFAIKELLLPVWFFEERMNLRSAKNIVNQMEEDVLTKEKSNQELRAKIEEFEAQIKEFSTEDSTNEALQSAVSEITEEIEKTREEATAETAKIDSKEGYIWIGDYNFDDELWSRRSLVWRSDSLGETTKPSKIIAGSEGIIRDPVSFRKEEPTDASGYYRVVSRWGVLYSGSKVTTLGKPFKIQGTSKGDQWWVKVRFVNDSTVPRTEAEQDEDGQAAAAVESKL